MCAEACMHNVIMQERWLSFICRRAFFLQKMDGLRRPSPHHRAWKMWFRAMTDLLTQSLTFPSYFSMDVWVGVRIGRFPIPLARLVWSFSCTLAEIFDFVYVFTIPSSSILSAPSGVIVLDCSFHRWNFQSTLEFFTHNFIHCGYFVEFSQDFVSVSSSFARGSWIVTNRHNRLQNLWVFCPRRCCKII